LGGAGYLNGFKKGIRASAVRALAFVVGVLGFALA
jgi:hypothetical protein